jgi:hypothetical protein
MTFVRGSLLVLCACVAAGSLLASAVPSSAASSDAAVARSAVRSLSDTASVSPPNDYLLVLDRRAGPYWYLNGFKKGQPNAYSLAVTAFGEPTRLRVRGNVCRVTWAGSGIRVGFASQLRPCVKANLAHSVWYGMSLRGARWHNRKLRVGDTVAKVRRLYPNARFDRPLGRRWLVLARKRVDEFNFIRLAVAVSRNGRVTSIEVPATYVY